MTKAQIKAGIIKGTGHFDVLIINGSVREKFEKYLDELADDKSTYEPKKVYKVIRDVVKNKEAKKLNITIILE